MQAMRASQSQNKKPSSIPALLSKAKGMLVVVGMTSGAVNVLALTGSFFMLQVYDRVLPSKSVPTLVGLIIMVGVLYSFYGLLEGIRARLLIRLGWVTDRHLSTPVFKTAMDQALRKKGDALQAIRDLDQVRGFLSGMGPSALLDLPWMPIYIAIGFLFHPWIGAYSAICAVLLSALAVYADFRARRPVATASDLGRQRSTLAHTVKQNMDVLHAMGFYGRLADKWHRTNHAYLEAQTSASDKTGDLGALTRVLRMTAQSGMLALGAILVLRQEATGGIIIASSILLSRSLAPLELAIGHWKGFISARQSWGRLKQIVSLAQQSDRSVDLSAPSGSLQLGGVTVVPPGGKAIIVQGATFSLSAGDGLGIIGPSASGKSTLLRAILGIWPAISGEVRLDGAALDQWSPEALGRHIGYLPQSVSLFEGTVSENISRFDPDARSEDILEAARIAGVHDMIVQMSDGYDTQIGDQGSCLSAGQRQRLGLARALFGSPFLVVLDEPNSNLDKEGELALASAISAVRNRGGIVIVVAHRRSALAAVDKVLAIAGGRIQAFGPRDEVLKHAAGQPGEPAKPVRLVAAQGEGS